MSWSHGTISPESNPSYRCNLFVPNSVTQRGIYVPKCRWILFLFSFVDDTTLEVSGLWQVPPHINIWRSKLRVCRRPLCKRVKVDCQFSWPRTATFLWTAFNVLLSHYLGRKLGSKQSKVSVGTGWACKRVTPLVPPPYWRDRLIPVSTRVGASESQERSYGPSREENLNLKRRQHNLLFNSCNVYWRRGGWVWGYQCGLKTTLSVVRT